MSDNRINLMELVNFEIHKHTILEFHPGVNVITGSSDEGKSSIIRSLGLLLFNRPLGTQYIKEGESYSLVSVRLDSNDRIDRVRSEEDNYYEHYKGDKKIGSYKALRSGIPEQISETMNMSRTNVQMQLDPHFLLNTSTSPGEVASQINKVAGLHDIDTTLGNVNKTTRKAKQEQENTKEKIKELTKQIHSYKQIYEIDTKLADLEEKHEHYESVSESYGKLDSYLKKMKRIKRDLEDYRKVLRKAEPKVDSIQKKLGSIRKIDYRLGRLLRLYNSIKRIEEQIGKEKELLDADATIQLIESMKDDYDSLNKRIQSLSSLHNKATSILKKLDKAKKEKKNTEVELAVFKENTRICPLCQTPFKQE